MGFEYKLWSFRFPDFDNCTAIKRLFSYGTHEVFMGRGARCLQFTRNCGKKSCICMHACLYIKKKDDKSYGTKYKHNLNKGYVGFSCAVHETISLKL